MKLVDKEFCISCARWYNPFVTTMHNLIDEGMYICENCLEYANTHEWELIQPPKGDIDDRQ